MLKTALLSLVLYLCLSPAKSQYRIGGIDTEKLWEHLPKNEVTKYDSILKSYQDSLIGEFEKLQAIINKETERFYCHDCPPPPDSIRNSRRNLFQNLVQQYSDFQANALKLTEQKMQTLKAELLNEIKEKIKPIAHENGYDIIIDLCSSFYLPPCTDVTRLVLQKLGWL